MNTFQDYGVQKKAFAGMKGDSGDDRVESHLAGEDLPFGVFVAQDPTTGKIFIPKDGGTGTVLGVTVHSHGVTSDGYKKGDTVSVMVQGAIWVRADETPSGKANWAERIGQTAQVAHGTGEISGNAGFLKGRIINVEDGLVQVYLS